MRVGVKSMLLLIAGYAVLITAFALGIDRWLHGFEDEVTLETSHLLAREEAAARPDVLFAKGLKPQLLPVPGPPIFPVGPYAALLRSAENGADVAYREL